MGRRLLRKLPANIDLARHLTLGTATWGLSLVHAAYLVVFAAIGLWLAGRAYTRKLVR